MSGMLESPGQFAMYKHFNFTREPVHNEIDLPALDLRMDAFERNITKMGYVEAAMKHYEEYSYLNRCYLLPLSFFGIEVV